VDESLVGTAEVAEMLGVSRQRVDQLTRTDEDFPEPLTTGRYRVWRRQDIVEWARATGREIVEG
jgi:predicted DNA-binding transcriptional regulator AlpA